MRALLVLAILIAPVMSIANDWSHSEITGTIDELGNFVIKFHVHIDATWGDLGAKAYVRARADEAIVSASLPDFMGLDFDAVGTPTYHTLTISSIPPDSSGITISGQLDSGNIARYIGSDNDITLGVQGVTGAMAITNREYTAGASRWFTFDVEAPSAWTPFDGVTITDSCAISGVMVTIRADQRTDNYIKWEYYDDISLEWVDFVPAAGDADNYSLAPIRGPSDTYKLTYLSTSNIFSVIGTRTDGQTRYTIKDPQSGLTETKAGPNIAGWCGFEEDLTAPVVSNVTCSHNTLSGYILSITTDDPCISRFRYRYDGGAWTDWSDWTTSYTTGNTHSISDLTNDESVDFEAELKNAGELQPATDPQTCNVPSGA